MKLSFILLFCFFYSAQSLAGLNITKLFSNSEITNEKTTLFLSTGEIINIENSNKELIEAAKKAYQNNEDIEISKSTSRENEADLIDNLTIVTDYSNNLSLIETRKEMHSLQRANSVEFQSFDPLEKSKMTKVKNYDFAQKVMDVFNGNTHDDSQCYNRAHMWSYESLVKKDVTLGKIWIFFTRKYIREFRYKWWFHIAPIINVDDGNGTYVLDRGFTMVPYNIENWKNIFIKNKAACPTITDYRTYERNQRSEYCYFIYSSQYYWQPWQLESLSKRRVHRFGYKMNELKTAFQDALRHKWDRVIPKLGQSFEDQTDHRPLSLYESVLYIQTHLVQKGIVKKVRRNGSYDIQNLGNQSYVKRVPRASLAKTSGCLSSLCVGDTVYNKKTQASAEIVGIQNDGRFVIRYLYYEHAGTVSANWKKQDLKKL